MSIKIQIENKHARTIDAPVIVCGNRGYSIEFIFDDEWDGAGAKTARFVYVRGGKVRYEDIVFTGNTVEVPILSSIQEVRVGVFAGDLSTTTPARIPCEFSIRCGTGAPEDPTPSQYDQIMALLQAGGGGGGGGGEIPETLPNPHALVFTGAVEATYDGSEAVEVVIPTGGGDGLAPLIVNGSPKCGTFIEAGDGFVRYTAAEPLKNSATGETISATEMKEEFDKGRYVHIRLYNTSTGVFISPNAQTFPDINYVEAGVISATKHPLLNEYMFMAIGTANTPVEKYSYRVQIDVTGSNNPEITATLYKAYEDEKETIYSEVDKRIANNNTTIYAEIDTRIENYINEALGGDY